MPHRPYGIPSPKPRPTYSGSTRAAWSGGAIIGGMILMVIVLGFIMYEVTKIGSHARNPATTAPHTTGQPEHGHPASMGGSGWQRSVRTPSRSILRREVSPPWRLFPSLRVLLPGWPGELKEQRGALTADFCCDESGATLLIRG